jgi:hypothetical protein
VSRRRNQGRLGRTLAQAKGALWVMLGLAVGVPLVLFVLLIAGLLLDVSVSVDLAWVLFAMAAGGALAAAVYFLRLRMEPREVVRITYEMRLEQPAVPLGRYLFELAVYLEALEQGVRHQTRQAKIELRFRGRDHPDLLAWCSEQVRAQLELHRRRAAESFPEAEILVSPAPSPARVAEYAVLADGADALG